jgi:diguanylate cyclase (GGDEF)-like protein/PAS domain S-box-containing protein
MGDTAAGRDHHLAHEVERRVRASLEQTIVWFRAPVAVYVLSQLLLSTEDHLWESVVVGVVLLLNGGLSQLVLRRDPGLPTLRRLGVASMAADVAVVALVVATHIREVDDPRHVVAIVPVLMAALRWGPKAGVAGVVATVGSISLWMTVIYAADGTRTPIDAVLPGGAFLLIGVTLAAVAGRLARERAITGRVLGLSKDLMATLDHQLRLRSVNAAGAVLLGYRPEEMIGRRYHDLIPGEDVRDESPARERLLAGSPIGIERRFVRADGEEVWLELNLVPSPADGLIYAIGRDVTERRAHQRAHEVAEQRYRSLFDHHPDAIYSLSFDGGFVEVNEGVSQLTGYSREEAVTTSWREVVAPADQDRVEALFEAAAAGQVQRYRCAITTKAGDHRDVDISNVPIVVDGQITGVYGIVKDVTDQRRLEHELRRQAEHDPLTGLANRLTMARRLAQALQARPVALLFIDLDRFKLVNDSLGHECGDALLRAVVGRLRAATRDDDLVARFAGDEFCIVLGGGATVEEAQAVADRILASLARPVLVKGREIFASASIGIALGGPGDDAEELLRKADVAMYSAKSGGRARACAYDPGAPEDALTRLSLESDLRRALERNELELHYQPQCGPREGALIGLEALVRWRHPERGLLGPGDFLPLAAEAGLLDAIDAWVVDAALRDVAAWKEDVAVDVPVAVNLSPSSLIRHGLADSVLGSLAATGVAPRLLTLELTEDVLLHHSDEANAAMAELLSAGVSFALDDFGSGYASLSQLKRFPVRVLKIDRSLVADIADDPQDEALVESVITLGEALGLLVIAEGVENDAQRNILAELGCEGIQGYLISRPIPADEVVRFLRRQASVSLAGAVDLRWEGELPLPWPELAAPAGAGIVTSTPRGGAVW